MVSKEVCYEYFNVKSYPTLMYLEGETAYTYSGSRELEDLVSFVKNKEHLKIEDKEKINPILGPDLPAEGFELLLQQAKKVNRKFRF